MRISPSQAAAELLRRRAARRSLLAWCELALAPLGFEPAAHHRLLIGELEHVARTPGDRVIVTMPPGSAKSTYTSVLFPAWFMAQGARRNIIAASHTMTLAEAFSGRVQSQIREHASTLGFALATENVKRWTTTAGCEYLPAGVGGAVTGFRADLGLIDDPVKSREDADSEVMREKAWSWYLADFRTRLKPGGRIAIVTTRWHEDDLAGRLLRQYPGEWRVVNLPALAEEGDALGRTVDEPLWSDDAYGFGAELIGKRAEYEKAGSMRDWYALYQQSPRNPEGALFRTAQIGVIDATPAGGRTVRGWDLAATESDGGRDPDWTVGVKLTAHADGRWTIDEVTRLRGGPAEVERAIVNTAHQDGRAVRISLPQDPGQAGKAQIAYLTSKLAGYSVSSTPETGDKATRAAPAAAQVNVGNVSMVRATWNAPLIDELRDFPTGRKDDQVDAFSRAFGALTTASRATTQRLGY